MTLEELGLIESRGVIEGKDVLALIAALREAWAENDQLISTILTHLIMRK